MLGSLGLPLSLAALPLAAGAMLLAIAAAPTAAAVACAEIVRKVCYSAPVHMILRYLRTKPNADLL